MKICYPVFSLWKNLGELGDNYNGTEAFKRRYVNDNMGLLNEGNVTR